MIFEVGNRKFDIEPKDYKIESIALYGSYAYGGADEKSDIDLLIIVNEPSSKRIWSLQKGIADELGIPAKWISIFNKGGFKRDATSGDSFLHSLKEYGKIIFSHSGFIEENLKSLPYYKSKSKFYTTKKNADTIIHRYRMGKADPKEVINRLALSIRQVCLEICYYHNDIEVDKYEPVRKCMEYKNVRIPFTLEEFEELYEYKRSYTIDNKYYIKIDNISDYIYKWYKRYNIIANQFI